MRKVLFAGAPRFNEFVVQTSEDPYAINSRMLGHKIVGGLPLKKFYPELGNAALWCCTELTTRSRSIRPSAWWRKASARCDQRMKNRCRGGGAMKHKTRKATRHINQNEGLIFEKSSPGKDSMETAAARRA